MTREEVMLVIHWDWILLFAGIVNVGAQLPQTWKLVKSRTTKGLSVEMIFIYLFTQIALSLNGYFMYDSVQSWTLGLSALVSAVNIRLYFKYRP